MKRWLFAGLALLSGCGEGAAPAPVTITATPAPTVAASDRARLRRDEARIERHCVAVSRSVVDPAAAPSAREEARAFAAADDLIAIVRASPRADLGAGQDLRLYLGDVIENLEGGNCDPRMREHLLEGLDSIPR
jgi:hypothetical protein